MGIGVIEWQKFIEAFKPGDKIQWKEAIWTSRPHNGRNQLAGEQDVTGEILSITEQSVNIRVIEARILEERLPASAKSDLVAHEADKDIRKKIETLLKGNIQKR